MVNSTAQSAAQSHATPIRQPDPMLAKPIVKWAGGKSKLVAELLQHVPEPFLNASCPESPRYIEPFAGGAALFFHLRYAPAVLGDMNPNLVTTYQAIRDEPDAVV